MKYPDVKVKLIGNDGNAYSIISAVSKALKKAGHSSLSFTAEAYNCKSYDELLCLVMKTVDVI